MALPADFSKIYGSTATGGLTPIGDVNYAKGWEFVGSNPPTKNDFSYLQNLSDLKSQWLYSNKLQRTDPFGDIKSDGTVQAALANLHLIGGLASDVVGRLIGVRVYTASTAYVETEGTKTGLAIITGGGGGGGSCQTSSTANTFSGAGGGAAGTCIGLFKLSDITNKAITIGAGGIGQTDGGNTTFAGMVAGGGKKGLWASPTSTPGGSGGTATGGILNIPGGMGNDGQAGAYLINGSGGGSLWGSGGRSGQEGGIGAPAYGAGGGGAYDTAFTNTTYQGGNGAPGVALILEFA